MINVMQSFPSKVPLVAFSMIVLHTLTACGKVTDQVTQPLSPAVTVTESNSLTGKVTLSGGKPTTAGNKIDVGGNPFCTGHGAITDPTWKVAEDGGLAGVVVSVRQTQRASNLHSEVPLIDQKNCEFLPHLSVIQSGQSVRLHNSDMTFHNIRVVRHEEGTSSKGENLANLAQPAQGAENLYSFPVPGIYRLECDVHRWMRAWVYVHDGIHATSTETDGTYTINRTLADGIYEVTAWHPKFAERITQTITVRGGHVKADFTFDLSKSFNL